MLRQNGPGLARGLGCVGVALWMALGGAPAHADTPQDAPPRVVFSASLQGAVDALLRARRMSASQFDEQAAEVDSARAQIARALRILRKSPRVAGGPPSRRRVTKKLHDAQKALRQIPDPLHLQLPADVTTQLIDVALTRFDAMSIDLPSSTSAPLVFFSVVPTPQVIQEYKSGISLDVLGTYGVDYLVENWYHDPKIDPRCTIYLRDDAKISFRHNAMNLMNGAVVVGVNGGGIIRYKVDQEQGRRAAWSTKPNLYPAFPAQPISFSQMQYDPGQPVVGAVGPVPGINPTDCLFGGKFYWRGVRDTVGDEWHTIAVGDDDQNVGAPNGPTFYDRNSSDGKVFTFVVNPKTPTVAVIKKNAASQFYTTPPKAYFVPNIQASTTYLTGDLDIELAALGSPAPQVQYSLRKAGTTADVWTVYKNPINTIQAGLERNTRYELRYRIDLTGPIRTRVLHYDPAYPSDSEKHPSDILWKGPAGLSLVRARIKDTSSARAVYRNVYNDVVTSSFINRLSPPYQLSFMNGLRTNDGGLATAINALPVLIDGIGLHPAQEQFVHDSMLDNFLNLDPVSLENNWPDDSPTKEVNFAGYYSVSTPIAVAISYDWLIKTFRSPATPRGFTAIEDYKLRDNLAAFASWTCVRYADPYRGFNDANNFDTGMWTTAWMIGTNIIAGVLPEYDSPVFGTSGSPIGSKPAPHLFAPFPDQAVTWWDLATDRNLSAPGAPNVGKKTGFYGVLNEKPEWLPQAGYLGHGTMAWCYWTLMNFRANYDGFHFTHLDSAFALAAQGQLKSVTDGANFTLNTTMLLNHNFPVIAPLTEAALPLTSSTGSNTTISYDLWYHNALALCLYEDDWRTVH